ncbi:MAG: SpoIID/LytB domain-containing protein [Paludibacteraceae bacterium]|nr:SpoIID/LytB domain-containing protein [Paludibacteraceae bacterium]
MGTHSTPALNIRVGILTAPKIEWEQRKDTFVLKNVRIGIGFHWDRHEDQEFAGTLEIKSVPNPVMQGGKPWQVAVNTIELEDYLCSVISSEMSANSPMELLKAHAVISRSWAIRAMEHPNHEGYHVCADDHCQRYEGLRRMNERAVEAVRATAGQVLVSTKGRCTMYEGAKEEICDCRYHKCCGGRTEIWRTCWEDIDVPYIQSVECPYCNPSYMDKSLVHRTSVLRTVLNDYDQETTDFHDWQVTYTAEELSAVIRGKSGIDFGEIIDLVPLHRGPSGRIDSLKIVGTKHTEVIGKELKIRLWLSKTCLYSSWFEISRKSKVESRKPQWVLRGHGWGHGAGLCQIGAAVMAAEGRTYEEILTHYYPGTTLKAQMVNE